MKTAEILLREVEAFMLKHDVPETRFGLESCNDKAAIRYLREKGVITSTRMDQMRDYMRNYKPTPAKRRRPVRRGAEVAA
jgi:hypothetical protein